MFKSIGILCVVFTVQSRCSEDISFNKLAAEKRNFIYNTYSYDVIYNLTLNETTEQVLDFTEDSNEFSGFPSRIHVSSNSSLDGQYPLFITAIQQKGVSSWELPLVIETKHSKQVFNNMARTLCPHDAGPNITTVNRPLVQISTKNPQNVSVAIKVKRVKDFYVQFNKEVEVTTMPATPKYYFFSFDENPPNITAKEHINIPHFNYTIPQSVILKIESNDSLCAIVSIQNNSCPVYDNEREVQYQGYHLTMTKKGGITLTQTMFPKGFYIVLIVKERDDECTNTDEILNGYRGDRLKSFRFTVIPTISYVEYAIAAVVTFALLISIYLLVIVLTYCNFTWHEEVLIVEPESIQGTSAQDLSDVIPINREYSSESELDETVDSEWPHTSTLAHLCKSHPSVRAKRSNRYFWSSATVAVVYALPVVQLLITYQKMVQETGEKDLCYYNFLCAHPLGSISDFNHVMSNCGYVILGLLFMIDVRRRQRKHVDEDLGIPQHFGLFYSMGLALIMEGILSACYHLCPNKMNFQFDSSFMYVIAVLCMVKLYQNRHPDVNARAHSTFLLIAGIMAVGVYGIMYPSLAYWILFTILHLLGCFLLTINIYYFGKFRMVPSFWRNLRSQGRTALVPHHRTRAVLLAIANGANWAFAIYGLARHSRDFARHLLIVLMGNAYIYLVFYVAMKIVHREKIRFASAMYLVLAHLAWILAFWLFLDSKTKWSETPAQSRVHNAPCVYLQTYDSHDVWHVTSAAALYLTFHALLSVDDPLTTVARERIALF